MADLRQGFVQAENNFTVLNKHVSFTIDKETGNVTEFINLYTNENILSSSAPFLYVKNRDKSQTLPTGVALCNGNLLFTFASSPSVEIKTEVFDNFITFEVMTELPKSVYSLVFANFETEYDTNEYRFNAIGMTAWVLPNHNSPYGIYRRHNCLVYTHFEPGTQGSKFGICFSKTSDCVSHVQNMAEHIDSSVGLYSKAGAPYAKEWTPNCLDYAMADDATPELLDFTLNTCKRCGAEELDIHMANRRSGGSFLQGTFEWLHFDSHEDFYERFGKKLHDNGVIYGLHSYSNYLSIDATEYVTDPYWQKQLLTIKETYTLKADVSEEDVDFPTLEDASGFIPLLPRKPYSRMLLIDEEIIVVDQYNENGFANCIRAHVGTKPAKHKAGTKVYQLAVRYSMFIPRYGSELFYTVADNMAKAYNASNYDMLYFDALDGMCYDEEFFELPEDSYAYYSQMYIHRVISQCNRTPVFESAAGSPQEYNVRGRVGAHDISVRAIKMTVKSHSERNIKAIKERNVVATLGWFSFFPDRVPVCDMKNTIKKSIFHDDLDYLGLYSILYGQTMVYSTMPDPTHTFHLSNVEYFQQYARLRKSDYFTQKTKDKLIEMGGEFKLVKKDDAYAFRQMSYNKENLGNIISEPSDAFSGSNPYAAQKPFVRLEQRWSTEFENELKLIDFDENKKLSEQTLLNQGFEFDMTNNMVLKFKVKGTGKDKDALLVTLKSAPSHWSKGRCDYFIDLNFEGWREFVMLDADNAEYDIEKYNFGPSIQNIAGAWSTINQSPGYEQIGEINLFVSGETATNAQISSIYAYTQTEDTVTNPTVTVADSSITFNTELKAGEYVEYEPDTNKAFVYHSQEQKVEEIGFTGELIVSSGSYVGKYSAQSETKAPTRAKLVLGFAGLEVENIK